MKRDKNEDIFTKPEREREREREFSSILEYLYGLYTPTPERGAGYLQKPSSWSMGPGLRSIICS